MTSYDRPGAARTMEPMTTTGFNHVATGTPDLDRIKEFYREAFGAETVFEMAAEPGHPRMAIIELGARR